MENKVDWQKTLRWRAGTGNDATWAYASGWKFAPLIQKTVVQRAISQKTMNPCISFVGCKLAMASKRKHWKSRSMLEMATGDQRKPEILQEVMVYWNSKVIRTSVIELGSLGFAEARDNLIWCEALCFCEMVVVELACYSVLSVTQLNCDTLHAGYHLSDGVWGTRNKILCVIGIAYLQNCCYGNQSVLSTSSCHRLTGGSRCPNGNVNYLTCVTRTTRAISCDVLLYRMDLRL